MNSGSCGLSGESSVDVKPRKLLDAVIIAHRSQSRPGVCSSVVECLPSMCKALPELSPQHSRNQDVCSSPSALKNIKGGTWWYTPTILACGMRTQNNCREFKVA